MDAVSAEMSQLEISKAELIVTPQVIQSQKGVLNRLKEAQEEFKQNGQARVELLGTIVAVETFYEKEWYYFGCPKLGCGKKMVKLSNSDYSCGKCNEHFVTFKPQILLRLKVNMDSNEIEMLAFDLVSLKLMDTTHVEIAFFETHSNEKLVEKVEALVGQKFNFVVKLKKNSMNDELQYIVDNVECVSENGDVTMDGDVTMEDCSKRILRKRKFEN